MNEILKSRFFGVALVIASLVALILSGYSSYSSRSYAECQSQVTEKLIRANTARALAAEEDRRADQKESQATADLINAVFNSASTQERIDAYAAYLATLTDVKKQREASAANRAANPLPEPPSEVCN